MWTSRNLRGRLTTCPDAATSYRRGVRCLLMDEGDPAPPIAAAIALDPTFALAHAALALLAHSRDLAVDVGARVRDAALHARRSSPVERGHVEAVLAWLDGDRVRAEQHAAAYPRDALVGALLSGRVLANRVPQSIS